MPPTMDISPVEAPSTFLLGVPLVRPSYLFVEHNCRFHNQSYRFSYQPGSQDKSYCVKISKDGTGATSESCHRETKNESILLESAVMSLDSDRKPVKCDNQELVEEIRWWLLDDLLIVYTCVDHYDKDQHDAGILLIIFWSAGTWGYNGVTSLPEHLRSVVLNVTGDALVNTIDWNCLDLEQGLRHKDMGPIMSSFKCYKDPHVWLKNPYFWVNMLILLILYVLLINATVKLRSVKQEVLGAQRQFLE